MGQQVKRPIIDVCVLHTGWVRYEVVAYLVNILGARTHSLIIRMSHAQPVAHNRNKIAQSFLRSDADYLLMIDSDQAIDCDLLKYAKNDLDIVGFPSPVFKVDQPADPIKWNLWMENEKGERTGGAIRADQPLVQVAGVGTGAILIARRVLEHPDMRAPFMDRWDEDGIRTESEDYTFCQRARAAGFEIWAATDSLIGHIKEVDLKHIVELMEQRAALSEQPTIAPAHAVQQAGKRLIFCLSPGRCGTKYLARVLDTLPGVTAMHEPEPSFHHTLRIAQNNGGLPYQFWLEHKLPAILGAPGETYIETSHLIMYSYLDALLNLGVIPDAVLVRRPHREVALSMWRRKAIPGRTDWGMKYHIGPDSSGALLYVKDVSGWSDYALCYWHCLEAELRSQQYASVLRSRGATVHETTLEEIATLDGLDALTDALRLPRLARDVDLKPDNRNPTGTGKRYPDEDLDAVEERLEEALLAC